MPSAASPPFTPDVVAAVTAHMNADHPEDNLLIVRALGGCADAVSANLVGVDAEGAHFAAEQADGAVQEAVVAWSGPVTERAAIRHEVVRMYQEACAALGVEPRAAEEH
ncbi:MAG: DUF2470 domain-containing protein [Actinobacteria bacterium]|nr:DUF2470 domain-containing protein [Actinomycetota bacterium]